MISSPLFARPPKITNASGEVNDAKSARASPRMRPVNSNTSFAILSLAIAASYTSLDVISSIGMLRSSDGSSLRASRNSRAVRATPVAEQYVSRHPQRVHPHWRPLRRTIT